MKQYALLLFMLVPVLSIQAQLVDYNKIVLPDHAQNVSFEERLVQLAWRNNPANHIVLEEVDIARQEVKIARSEWTNTLGVAGNLNEFNIKSYTDKTYTAASFFPRYNFFVRLPLSLLVETPRKRNVAQSKLTMAQEQINLAKITTRASVLRLYSEYKKLELIWIIRKQSMEDEESNYLLAEQKFKDGEGNVEEFMKSQRSRNEQKIQLAIAENEFVKAKLSVEEVIGVKIEDVK